MFKRLKEDRLLLLSTLILVAFGLLMVYSASSVMALKRYGDSAYFLKRQAIWAGGGLIAMYAAWRMDYRNFKYAAIPALAVIFILLLLVLVPGIGAEINGAKRWIRIAGFSIQPSEFVKPALIMVIAASLARRAEKLADFWFGLGPYLLLSGAFMLLIVIEPDLGTAAALGVVIITMLFVAGAKPAHMLYLVLAVTPVLYYELMHVSFRLKRLMVYIDPWQDPLGKGFQTIQSFLAFGGGGLTGLGLGESRQKLLFLPEPHSDFIFSVIGEEFGLMGAISVAILFALFTLCGMRLALKCQDRFGSLLAFGLTLMIGLQSIINMGVTTGLFPNKGMPLPFISAGGSSIFVALLSVGMLLSIARGNGSRAGVEVGPSMQAAR